MSKRSSQHIILLSIFLLWFTSLFSQETKEQLQVKKQQLEKEIEYTDNLLSSTKKDRSTSLNQLVLIKSQIKNREELIDNIELQINTLDYNITLNNEIIKQLNNDMESLKEEYAAIIYNTYKNHDSFNRFMFIFASKDFNQAFRRIKYFQQYAAYRRNQAELIEKTQAEIDARLLELEIQKEEKMTLLSGLQTEKEKLLSEKNDKNTMVVQLSKKEKELKSSLQEKQTAANELQKKIDKIIADEIAKANKKKGTSNTQSFALTPEEQKLSNDFELNKGKLPWPVERGVISSTYGVHSHELVKGVKTQNNGITILTAENSVTRAIFTGEVTWVGVIDNFQNVVMIKHGEYISVYANMKSVKVKKGEMVETKQAIGTLFTTPENKTEINFRLTKGKNYLDPMSWLAKGK